jgi:hypothetical protein
VASQYLWSTGETTQAIGVSQPGAYWVNLDSGDGCWGNVGVTVALHNCGSPTGDTNLDGTTDGADLSALVSELSDGDGNTVVGSGGGDLQAPGADITQEGLINSDDYDALLGILFSFE